MMADQSHLGGIEKLTSDILAQFRKMDLLLINAEITKSAPIESISQQVFDEIKDVNFNGAYFTLSRFIAIQDEGASVIFLSSTSATISPPMASVYASSKAAFITEVIFLSMADNHYEYFRGDPFQKNGSEHHLYHRSLKVKLDF